MRWRECRPAVSVPAERGSEARPGGSRELLGPQGRDPTLCEAPEGTQSPALATLAFSAAARPQPTPVPRSPRGEQGTGLGTLARSPLCGPRAPPSSPGLSHRCQEPLDKQGALPSLAHSRLRHPARPLRMPPSRLPRGHVPRPRPMTGASSPQPRKSTRQSTHVEEIGLVPLAEEPLCRHVLQLLPRDTTA